MNKKIPGFAALLSWLLTAGSTALAQNPSPTEDVNNNVMRGWRLFHQKGCVNCHSVWGYGGRLGPDLGRSQTGRATPASLAGVMWNHIPKMRGEIRQAGLAATSLTSEEMGDLFALIFFVRQLDESGDPIRGEQILRTKGCSQCHETSNLERVGPDLAQWARHPNPIQWAQIMWQHAPSMEEAMKRAGMAWPKLEGNDLVHIVAYVRSRWATGEKTYLQPGSAARGRALFQDKKCDGCHPGRGPDLEKIALPATAGALASRMWNHSPDMARMMVEQDVGREPVSAQELVDIVVYILSLGRRDNRGDSQIGRSVFVAKGCADCHPGGPEVVSIAPPVQKLGADSDAVNMAAAMWNHGETMLERMTQVGIPWPVFEGDEMNDVLAFLAAVEKAREGETEQPKQ